MKPGQRVHFVGVGGIGMSGLARVLLQLGWDVSGSDLKSSSITHKLEEMGARIYMGHRAENLEYADVVVLSSAIGSTNPEVTEAYRRELTVYSRSQVLAYLMSQRFGIAIAGTHGKTTTSSMVTDMLEQCGLRPTSVIGGEVLNIGSNAQLGAGPHLVCEADESDASFLDYHPKVAVVTNIDSDVNLSAPHFEGHNFDYEKTMKRIVDMFVDFMNQVPSDGKLLLCADSDLILEQLSKVKAPYMTYGLSAKADLTADHIVLDGFTSRCRVLLRGQELGPMRLQIPGRHNVQNALAALAVGLEIGLTFEQCATALENFGGVKRRFQILGVFGGVTVVDDYAHNPAKVKAALHAAKSGATQGRVIGVFQPHRYTRTKFLAHEFGGAFEDADVLLMTDIYSAGEVPIVGVRTEMLMELTRQHGKPTSIHHTPGQKEVIDFLLRECREGDVVITMGAGDVGSWGARLCDFLVATKPHTRAAAI